MFMHQESTFSGVKGCKIMVGGKWRHRGSEQTASSSVYGNVKCEEETLKTDVEIIRDLMVKVFVCH